MKKFSSIWLHLTLLMTLVFWQSGYAQSDQGKSWILDSKGKNYALDGTGGSQASSGYLNIYLKNHSGETTAILREGKEAEPSINVNAWVVKYKDLARPSTLSNLVESVSTIADKDVEFLNSTLTINENTSKNERCLIDVIVPAGKKVNLYVDSELKYSGLVVGNVLLSGANITLNAQGVERSMLITQLLMSPIIKNPNAKKLQAGTLISPPNNSLKSPYLVSWDILKEQVKELPAVVSINPPQGGNCQACSASVLRIALDAQGNITKLEWVGGNKELSVNAISALYQWRFKPFLVNGEAISVESIVPVKIENGKLLFESDAK